MIDFLNHTIQDITSLYEAEKKTFASNSWMVVHLSE